MTTEEKAAKIIEDIRGQTGTNPIRMFKALTKNDYINIHGPEHHILDGACLLMAYHNAGGKIDIDEALKKILYEGLRMPGAMCGLWGICGAITSIGAALAIIDGTGPLTADGTWGNHMAFTSSAIGELGKINGPRCCKRDAMIAFKHGIEYVNQHYGVQLEYENQTCEFSSQNQQCIKDRCPFYKNKPVAFFSGFPARRFTAEIAERLKKDLPVRHCIVFITACPVDFQRNDEDSAGMHGMFVEYEMGFEKFCVVDARMDPADAQKWAREADCIFLMGGGSCSEQMQLMRDKGIYEIVRDSPAMVLGVSAGSMNMGKITVDVFESLVPYEGLGFADITMIGHFSYDDIERLRLMKQVSMDRPVCAMEDESVIFISNGKVEIIGTIHKIVKKEIWPFTKEDVRF